MPYKLISLVLLLFFLTIYSYSENHLSFLKKNPQFLKKLKKILLK